ncbi:MAG TPA: IPT/TIG domain-containing protein [Longimicrobium sp.]|nr:IPT/TIG domain-containing protein [Longimicrobium sp.]
MKIFRSPRLLGRALRSPLALLVLAAACTDDSAPAPTALVADPEGTLGVLQCEVTVASGDLSCVDASGRNGASASRAVAGGPSAEVRTFGKQGTYVRLANSGNSRVGDVYSINVTVQNLANLALATADGATRHADGVRIWFTGDPQATRGAGEVSVANPTGTAMFTAADQPYFQYGGSIGGTDQGELGADGVLASAETSTAKSWQFDLDAAVEAFSFLVYVRTETAPGTMETVAPQVAGVSPNPMVPGQAATITGSNFHLTPGSNTVRIGGVAATVTGSTATTLSVIVPCTNSGSVPVQVTQGGMTGVAVASPLQAVQRTLGVGASVIVTNTAEVGCNEIMPSGGASRYVMAVYNAGTSPNVSVGIQVSGDPTAAPGALASSASPALMAPRLSQAGEMAPGGDDPHWRLLEGNRRQAELLHARFRNDPRMRASRDVVSRDPVAPPATRTFHVANINAGGSFCSNYYVAAGTRVYYNGKLAIYEDDATPAGLKAAANPTMQDYYNRIGDQFNADMEPIISTNFGDVLRRDAVTDNNGVMVAFFTPLINNTFSGVAGFVVSCDQFPDADAAEPAVGGPYAGAAGNNGSSNFGEVFYAYQPTSTGSGFGTVGTPDYWYRTIRSTFIHETKHVASQAARVANGTGNFEQSWLEEGTARHSEELWMRNAVDNVAWKGNTGYGSAANAINIYCDVRPTGFPECAANTRRPAAIMQRHFTSLYTQMFGTNARLLSPFGPTPSDNASYFYAVSWSLARYAIDRYGASDAAFLTGLTQSTSVGTANLAAQSGVAIDRLLGGWALSLAVDDYPGLATPGLDIQMPTWNFRNIYAGLNTDFPGTYTLAYPLQPTSFTFGNFAPVNVATMYGGGALFYQVSGTHTQPQIVRLLGNGGAALSSNVRIAITRVQ